MPFQRWEQGDKVEELETFPLACPNCGAAMWIIAFITEATPIRRILQSVGEPHEPPSLHPPRNPPAGADDAPALCLDEDRNQHRYEYEFDQRVTW